MGGKLVLRKSLLGIVTSRKLSHQVVEANLPYLLAAKKQGYAAVIIHPAAIQWNRKTVYGITLNNERRGNHLMATNQQLPSIIYNRVPTRAEENSPAITRFKKQCITCKIPVFNTSFLSKHNIYQLLRLSKAAPFLPETDHGLNEELIHLFLQRYTQVYLKPVNGSHGRGIIRLQKKSQVEWQMDYGYHSSYRLQSYTSLKEMIQQATARTTNRDFLIQRGIGLKTFHSHPIDFRLHVHRGGTGAWEVINCAAQAGVKGSVTTNPRSGGQFIPALAIFREWYGSMGETRLHKLGQIALDIASEVQQHHEGLFGEFGLDLGIDQNEQVWLLEVNSKPAPVNLRDLDIRLDSRKQSAIKTVEFASFLQQGKSG